MNMTGNTILITGAGSGIGLALAEEFARMDNQVIVAARSPEKLKAAERRGLATIPADVSDAASIQALATRVIQGSRKPTLWSTMPPSRREKTWSRAETRSYRKKLLLRTSWVQ